MSAVDFNAKAEPASGTPSNSSDTLESWHQQYDAIDADRLSPEDSVIHAVQSDYLDRDQIETEVQQLVSAVDVTRGFCGTCRDVLSDWPKHDPGRAWKWPGHCDLVRVMHTVEVEAAARAGCIFCAFLTSRLKLESLFDTFRKIEVRLRNLGDSRTASLAVLSSGTVQAHWLNFPGKEASHFRYGARTLPCAFLSQTLEPTSLKWNPNRVLEPFELAKTWLAWCANGHENCRRKKAHRPPTRLVSIGHGAVRLVITADLEQSPHYASLSYCWGRKPFTMLTQDNLKSFLECILLQDLPQTFIDAIHVTRQLGLEYIWIDALCIIQNEPDKSDWKKEASRMRSVYGGSFVNLAVSTAPSVYDGFLHLPKLSGGFVARVSTSDRSRVQGFYSPSTYGEVTEQSHLAGRAWTFQERLLPARTIHFSGTGLFWECCSRLASESLPDEVPPSRASALLCREDQPWQQWSEIVRIYSGANLTYGSDRLPALSGIAQRQYELTGDSYLAGLWKDSLIEQLSWEVTGRRKSRPEWRAPTWSWASVDGQSSYSGDLFPRHALNAFLTPAPRAVRYMPFTVGPQIREYVQVQEVWTTPSGLDPHGAVGRGELTLLCSHFVRGHIHTTGDPESSNYLVRMANKIQVGPVQVDCLDAVSERGGDVIYLLPLKRSMPIDGPFVKDNTKGDHIRKFICGLIIRASDNSTDRFRRVGYFKFENHRDRDENVYQVFMDILENDGPSAAETDYAIAQSVTEDEQWRYRITIE